MRSVISPLDPPGRTSETACRVLRDEKEERGKAKYGQVARPDLVLNETSSRSSIRRVGPTNKLTDDHRSNSHLFGDTDIEYDTSDECRRGLSGIFTTGSDGDPEGTPVLRPGSRAEILDGPSISDWRAVGNQAWPPYRQTSEATGPPVRLWGGGTAM